MGRAGCAHACASARAPALARLCAWRAPCACPSSLLLVAALAPLEHLFSPSPWLPFLPFARSLVPARHSNTCSPRRLGCPSRSSRARLRRATRTSVLSIALVASLAPHAHSPAGLLAHAARRPPADHRRARPPAEHCLGLGLRRGGYVSGLLVAKNEGGGFLLQRKSVV